MAIKFACDCGTQFVARDEQAGRAGVCHVCKKRFTVPLPDERSPAQPVLRPVPSPIPTTDDPTIEPPARANSPRPVWKDPIAIGIALSGSILLLFLGYLAGSHLRSGSVAGVSEQVANAKPLFVEPAATHLPARNPKIPIEVSYPVIDGYREPPWKRGLDVQLNMKVSEEVLREIALELKSQETEQYERTYVSYFLPGMKMTGSVWANADFAPTLKVEILGLSIEEEQYLLRQPFSLPEGSELIGSWLPSEAFTKWRITIFRKDGKYYLEACTSRARDKCKK